MTELEIMGLVSTLRTESALHAMNFFSIWTGYVLAVYFIGPNLSRVYAFLLTTIYSLYALVVALTGIKVMPEIYALYDLYKQTYPSGSLVSTASSVNSLYVLRAVFVSAWVISILFMLHRRKTAAKTG